MLEAKYIIFTKVNCLDSLKIWAKWISKQNYLELEKYFSIEVRIFQRNFNIISDVKFVQYLPEYKPQSKNGKSTAIHQRKDQRRRQDPPAQRQTLKYEKDITQWIERDPCHNLLSLFR